MASRKPLALDPVVEAHRQWTEHGWTSAAEGMAAVTSITRVAQIYLARIDEVLRPFELTFARYELLMLLSFTRKGALPMSKLGARLQVHPASVTSAVDRLERQALVRRLAHPTDRRTTLAEITALGLTVAEQATEAVNARVFADPGLSVEQTKELTALLVGLRRSAGDF